MVSYTLKTTRRIPYSSANRWFKLVHCTMKCMNHEMFHKYNFILSRKEFRCMILCILLPDMVVNNNVITTIAVKWSKYVTFNTNQSISQSYSDDLASLWFDLCVFK